MFINNIVAVYYMDYLNKIKSLRESKGYSQTKMAKLLNLSHTGYNLIESGKRGLDILKLIEISKILEVNIGYFFGEMFQNETMGKLNIINKGITEEMSLIVTLNGYFTIKSLFKMYDNKTLKDIDFIYNSVFSEEDRTNYNGFLKDKLTSHYDGFFSGGHNSNLSLGILIFLGCLDCLSEKTTKFLKKKQKEYIKQLTDYLKNNEAIKAALTLNHLSEVEILKHIEEFIAEYSSKWPYLFYEHSKIEVGEYDFDKP